MLLVCLSFSNGVDAYGKIILNVDNTIKEIQFVNYGRNFSTNEETLIDIYSLPDNLEFIDNNFKYI